MISARSEPEPEPEAAGAKSSIEELFEALESPLLGYALRLARERELAEDIVQEAFMKLHGQFESVEEPRRWLFRTVHNLALNHLRQGRKVVSMAEVEGDGEDGGGGAGRDGGLLPDEVLARWEGIGLVRLSVAGLDLRAREVVRLKFEEELSYRDIGLRTGLSEGHVGYVLHHALKSIASELAREGFVR